MDVFEFNESLQSDEYRLWYILHNVYESSFKGLNCVQPIYAHMKKKLHFMLHACVWCVIVAKKQTKKQQTEMFSFSFFAF